MANVLRRAVVALGNRCTSRSISSIAVQRSIRNSVSRSRFMKAGAIQPHFVERQQQLEQRRPVSSAVLSAVAAASEYKVEQWTETPYLEYIVGLEPEGSTPSTSTGGSTLGGVRGENRRPHPGYTARLIRLRIESGASVKAREAILDEKSYMRDFGRFWIPMISDLLGGAHHQFCLEIFEWMLEHPNVLKSARRLELERLYSMMISYAGVVGKVELARRWFEDMEQRGMPKSTHCCNALIIAYAKSWDTESALAIYKNMKEYHKECPPNAMTFYVLAAMYARLEDWRNMESMVDACKEAGFAINSITYSTLLCAYARMKRYDLFEAALEEAKCNKLELRDEVCSAMVFGYSLLDVPEKAMQVLKEMIEVKNVGAVPVSVLQEFAASCGRKGLVEELQGLQGAAPELAELASRFC